MKKILVTGAAGFIGFYISKKLLERGDKVIGIDNLNDYYDISLKKDRLKELEKFKNFKFIKKDISEGIPVEEKIDLICHLAAQAGVRNSIKKPFDYQKSNSLGTLQVFEFARQKNISKVVFASSSSVYGSRGNPPFKEDQNANDPISLYAATKRSNELYAKVYNHLYGIKMIGLRFFTVYGPWGRPDMAYFKFIKKIFKGEEIEIFNNGEMKRDFTYIEDIVSGVLSSLDKDIGEYEIINLARGEEINLMDFVDLLEKYSGREAKKRMLGMQPGDVPLTSGDITKAKNLLGYFPKTSVEEGIKNFVGWYKEYYGK